ncbi:hypothetical protein K432DRAFT_429279 [Lepidopterella palustris CBS 459.81]|uniref:Uncharacterized protein n=1 Tax=Lepidopterella palustris CBS 459.81 TaxID=1314670 RepID=A0A8E2JAP1_9PEZI|nr:hypothetical protein K432DRAFT_429279 [Lepidopterella palustris CBS 459.81]
MSLIFPTPVITTSAAIGVASSAVLFQASSFCLPSPPSYTSLLGTPSVADEGAIVPENYTKDLFSDFGFVVRARTDDNEDLLLWMFLYRQLGQDTVIDDDISQTALLVTNFSTSEKAAGMHDTPYLNKGQNIDDYYSVGSLQNTETPDQSTWSCGGRVLSRSSPPHWKASGTHAGIQVDLDFTQRSDFYYHIAPFSTLKNGEGDAGGIIHLRANGTVTDTTKNKTYAFTDGHAVHERIIMAGVVPARLNYMGGRGSPWINSWGPNFSFWTLDFDTGNDTFSSQLMVSIDNTTLLAVGSLYAQTSVLDTWFDPKTNQINPRTWKVTAVTEKGVLDATVSAYGRYFYTWVRRGGTILVHCYIADTIATFTRDDGTVVSERQVAMVEYMRTLYNQGLTEA